MKKIETLEQNPLEDFHNFLEKNRNATLDKVLKNLAQQPCWEDENFFIDYDETLFKFLSKSCRSYKERQIVQNNVKLIFLVCRNITLLSKIKDSTNYINFFKKIIVSHINQCETSKIKYFYEIFYPKIFYDLSNILSNEKASWKLIDKNLVGKFFHENTKMFVSQNTYAQLKFSMKEIENLVNSLNENTSPIVSKKHFEDIWDEKLYEDFEDICLYFELWDLRFKKRKILLKINKLWRKVKIAWWKTHPDKNPNSDFVQSTLSKNIIIKDLREKINYLKNI